MPAIVPQAITKIKFMLIVVTIVLASLAFAIGLDQPVHPTETVRSVSPDLIIFTEESRAILVNTNGRTWVMEV